jgi:hypothetical protein
MTTALTTKEQNAAEIIERVVAVGDLSKITPQERVNYYRAVCESVGLNPLTRPFEYITLNGKLTLYARKDCTDQLRQLHEVSVDSLDDKVIDGVYIVNAKVHNAKGRTDMAKGAVHIDGLKGDALANALMKAETKAKRRATLSICGLGFLDESELDTIPPQAFKDQRPAQQAASSKKCGWCYGHGAPAPGCENCGNVSTPSQQAATTQAGKEPTAAAPGTAPPMNFLTFCNEAKKLSPRSEKETRTALAKFVNASGGKHDKIPPAEMDAALVAMANDEFDWTSATIRQPG